MKAVKKRVAIASALLVVTAMIFLCTVLISERQNGPPASTFDTCEGLPEVLDQSCLDRILYESNKFNEDLVYVYGIHYDQPKGIEGGLKNYTLLEITYDPSSKETLKAKQTHWVNLNDDPDNEELLDIHFSSIKDIMNYCLSVNSIPMEQLHIVDATNCYANESNVCQLRFDDLLRLTQVVNYSEDRTHCDCFSILYGFQPSNENSMNTESSNESGGCGCGCGNTSTVDCEEGCDFL